VTSVDLGPSLSPKRGDTRGLIGHVGGDGGDWRLRSGSKEAMSVKKELWVVEFPLGLECQIAIHRNFEVSFH
jgi:hypothetical protein